MVRWNECIESIKVFKTVTLDIVTKKVVHVNQLMHWQKTPILIEGR